MPERSVLPMVAVYGSPPRSVLFELQRMGREWFVVEHVESLASVAPEALAVLWYTRDDTAAPHPCDVRASLASVLELVCGRSSAIETTRCREVERFDVAVPLQRLALLARLATLRSEKREARSEKREARSVAWPVACAPSSTAFVCMWKCASWERGWL